MIPAERQYRRVLRLLPADYRQRWEEDMVSAYLDSVADRPRRRPVGEWLAVAWLALRLRLSGSPATPRAQLWYQTVLGVALLTTLYESLEATSRFAHPIATAMTANVDLGTPANHVAYWLEHLSLVWVGAFVGLVLGRLVLARVLALVGVAHAFGLTALIVATTLKPTWWAGVLPYEGSTMHQAWLCLTVVAVFLVPRDFRPARAWLAAYLVPAAAILPASALLTAQSNRWAIDSEPYPEWLRPLSLVSVGPLLHLGLIVGMVVALLRARRWLLPLAAFGGAVAVVQLMGYAYGGGLGIAWWPEGMAVWTAMNVGQLVLAVACAAVGLVAVLRARTAARPESADGRPHVS